MADSSSRLVRRYSSTCSLQAEMRALGDAAVVNLSALTRVFHSVDRPMLRAGPPFSQRLDRIDFVADQVRQQVLEGTLLVVIKTVPDGIAARHLFVAQFRDQGFYRLMFNVQQPQGFRPLNCGSHTVAPYPLLYWFSVLDFTNAIERLRVTSSEVKG